MNQELDCLIATRDRLSGDKQSDGKQSLVVSWWTINEENTREMTAKWNDKRGSKRTAMKGDCGS